MLLRRFSVSKRIYSVALPIPNSIAFTRPPIAAIGMDFFIIPPINLDIPPEALAKSLSSIVPSAFFAVAGSTLRFFSLRPAFMRSCSAFTPLSRCFSLLNCSSSLSLAFLSRSFSALSLRLGSVVRLMKSSNLLMSRLSWAMFSSHLLISSLKPCTLSSASS